MENSNLLNKNYLIKKKTRFTQIGFTKYLKGIKKPHLIWCDGKIFNELAVKSWEISPGNETITPKAYFLEGQLNRITNTAFTDKPISMMQGGYSIKHPPTRAYMLKNVWMINGSLYKGLHQFKLHPASQYKTKIQPFPPIKVDTEINIASIYNSYPSHQYFGTWLLLDCNIYPLAASEGLPVTSNIYASPHMLEYESLLDMKPFRTNAAYLENTIFFNDDCGMNADKHKRFSANRKKLLSIFPSTSHPGVFILRRNSGQSRIMINELEIAEQLKNKYGFKVVDVNKHSVAEILTACAGAKILIGIEGSQLIHGLMVLQPGASVLILQPPDRFCGVIKMTTDMENQNFAFVVGIPKEEGFYIDMEEVERTIDLLPL